MPSIFVRISAFPRRQSTLSYFRVHGRRRDCTSAFNYADDSGILYTATSQLSSAPQLHFSTHIPAPAAFFCALHRSLTPYIVYIHHFTPAPSITRYGLPSLSDTIEAMRPAREPGNSEPIQKRHVHSVQTAAAMLKARAKKT